MPTTKRNPGPRPTMDAPEKLTVMVERLMMKAIDAEAKRQGCDRSKAVRELLAAALAAKKTKAPAAFNASLES